MKALFVPEQLRFDQFARDRRAVNGNEGFVGTGTAEVEIARNDFLAGAGLALDENAAFAVFERVDF